MPVVPVELLREHCEAIFRLHDFTAEEADACSEEIVEAETRGRRSHGVAMLPRILEWKLQATAEPQITHETPVAAHLDGNGTVGPLLARSAMEMAVSKARAASIGVVGARNPSMFLTAGCNPRRAANQGLIAFNCSVAASKVAVWGGAPAIIGTNPVGLAVPTEDGPVVLDLSIGESSVAEIRRAVRDGEQLPPGVAISPEGLATTDPRAALAGALLPFGEHKGSGLGLMIEMLAGALVGAKTGTTVAGGRGILCVAIDPNIFGLADRFRASVLALANEIHGAPPRAGFAEVLLPGDRGEQLAAHAREHGVELDEQSYAQLRELGQPA
jgi:LDH2 family malate/lactate/ureidoglycolate dehydrogenase